MKKEKKVAILIYTQDQKTGSDTAIKLNAWFCKEENMGHHEIMGGFKNEQHFLDCMNELVSIERSFDLMVAMKAGNNSENWPLILKIHRIGIPLLVWSESTFLRTPCERHGIKFVNIHKENQRLGLERVFYMIMHMICTK